MNEHKRSRQGEAAWGLGGATSLRGLAADLILSEILVSTSFYNTLCDLTQVLCYQPELLKCCFEVIHDLAGQNAGLRNVVGVFELIFLHTTEREDARVTAEMAGT